MVSKLNLLPPEYSVSKGLSRLLKTARMLGVISLAAFLVFALVLVAFFIFSSLELRNLTTENDGLKSQITAQSASEQQLVLIKDRIKKAKAVRGVTNALRNLDSFEALTASISADVDLTEVTVDPQKIDLSVRLDSNSELTSFMGVLTDSGLFKSVVLTSFGFNPVGGYLANIRID